MSAFCFTGVYLYFHVTSELQSFPLESNSYLCLFCLNSAGTPCFRGFGRRNGERRRKSVRGCIVSQDLSVINLVIVKKGENDLPGLTDTEKPRMRGPKRASKIKKLFNLGKDDDVRSYVNTYRRTFLNKKGELSTVLVYCISPVLVPSWILLCYFVLLHFS